MSTNNLFVSKSGESVEIYLGISGPKFFRDFFKFSHLEVNKQKTVKNFGVSAFGGHENSFPKIFLNLFSEIS